MNERFAGRYELIDPLGSGGAGVVWRAWDHRERRYIAAKLLRKVDATNLIRFVREQSYRIDHPHVLTPLGWAADEDQVLLALPLVRGGDLAILMGDYGALPAPLVARLVGQVLAALDAIHAAGLVHRDVKPSNVLLDATGMDVPRARVGDFGIAVAINEPRLTAHGDVLGTQGYVAPESRRGDGDPSPAADLYATGLLGLELLSGDPVRTPPFPSDETGDAQTLYEFLTRLSATRPEDRPASAALALDELMHLGAYRAPLGGDVEIFDQLPDLPEGWGPDGPEAGPAHDAVRGDAGSRASVRVSEHRGDVESSQRRGVVGPILAVVAGVALILAAIVLAL